MPDTEYITPEPISVKRVDGRIFVSYGNTEINGVKGYSIESAPDGGEDITLKIHVPGACVMSHVTATMS